MAVTDVMSVNEFGMAYQQARIETASINVANANVIQPSDGSGFKPLSVSVQGSFDGLLWDPKFIDVYATDAPDKLAYQPDHPAADVNGYVHFAAVDMAQQMIIMTQATRAYEANIKAFNAQMDMTIKALEIGK